MEEEVEWDEAINIECPTYNFFSNGYDHESAFFLMIRKDIHTLLLANPLQPKLQYVGNKEINNPLRQQRTSQNSQLKILYF